MLRSTTDFCLVYLANFNIIDSDFLGFFNICRQHVQQTNEIEEMLSFTKPQAHKVMLLRDTVW